MERKPLSGDDVRLLNEQIQSHDLGESEYARQVLFESFQDAHRFCDSTAQEWARRIVRRESRAMSRACL
ncbi:MAG: hypothetical protein JO002_07745 [Burkholderiaceae bacterium]|nr:hypothetical protein [Burkholderiaceae bacterium]